ncbi:hypothetical protein ACOMHN_010735 [Nucella lapillus]
MVVVVVIVTFDLFILVVSFVVDVVFMQILPRFKIQDFVFILAFLLPWRVIRVVNSLVVAVQDHEHFRLKMVYSRKKKIQNSLREAEVKLQLFRAQCCALKRLCLNEGVEECKIEEIVQLDEYVVNRTGKSKCKVKIDNTSVILLDKSDFPMGPRPGQHASRDKRRSLRPSDSAREFSALDQLDLAHKRNGHSPASSLEVPPSRDGVWRGMGRKLSISFSNGPLSALFGHRSLAAVPEDGEGSGGGGGLAPVRRTSSQGLICAAIKRDLYLFKGGLSAAENGTTLKPEGSAVEHEPGHVTSAKDAGTVGRCAAEKADSPAAGHASAHCGDTTAAGGRVVRSVSLHEVSDSGSPAACSSGVDNSGVRSSLSVSSQLGQEGGDAEDLRDCLSDPLPPSRLPSAVSETGLCDCGNTTTPNYAVTNGDTAPGVVVMGDPVPSVSIHVEEDSGELPHSHRNSAENPGPLPATQLADDSTCSRAGRQESPPAVLAVPQGQTLPAAEASLGFQDQAADPADLEGRVVKDWDCAVKEDGDQVPEQRSPDLDLPQVVSRSVSGLSDDRLSDVTVVGEGVDKDDCLTSPTNDVTLSEESAGAVSEGRDAELHSDNTDLFSDEGKSEADTEPTSSVSHGKTSESETLSTICDSLQSLPPLDDTVVMVNETAEGDDSDGRHADAGVTSAISPATGKDGQSVGRTMPHGSRET